MLCSTMDPTIVHPLTISPTPSQSLKKFLCGKTHLLMGLVLLAVSTFFYTSLPYGYLKYTVPLTLFPPKTADTKGSLCGYLIRSKLPGGLGNQMFIYASFYGITHSLGTPPNKTALVHAWSVPSELDNVFENLSIIQLALPDSWFKSKRFLNIGERACCLYDNYKFENLSMCDGKNVSIGGYRQSFKYFQDVFEGIRREFSFKKDIRDHAHDLIAENLIKNDLNKTDCTRVGVHLRRGDFVWTEKQEFGHKPVTAEYFQKAVTYFETRLYSENASCLMLLVFGNDNDWNLKAIDSIQLLKQNDTLVIPLDTRHSDAGVVLCAMTLCDHMITSTGTFSWWAGFFSQGIVTYQKEYARPGSTLFVQYEPKDYFPDHWVAL